MKSGILVLNAGSSSIKFSVYSVNGEFSLLSKGQVEGIGVNPKFLAKNQSGQILGNAEWKNSEEINHVFLMKYLIGWVKENHKGINLIAAGHRVVHGGLEYSAPIVINDSILNSLEKLIPLAPLHQPHNLAAIKALKVAYPSLTQVACFDTSFHRTNPSTFQNFFLPKEIRDAGVRRYGFHGLSYEYIVRRLNELDPVAAQSRTIVAHLGSGASMCAINHGKSVCSSMGMTALDGLPMGTRPGNLDAGVVLFLMQEMKMDAKALENLFYKKSGLLGLSGISNDMRPLEESLDPRAKETVDAFAWKICQMAGNLVASIEGIDTFVFTGGIGENSKLIRRLVVDRLQWLGLEIDETKNQENALILSSSKSRVKIFVIPTNEELMIATHTKGLVTANP